MSQDGRESHVKSSMSFVSSASEDKAWDAQVCFNTGENDVNIYKSIRTPTPSLSVGASRSLSQIERDVRELTQRSHDACESHATSRESEWHPSIVA